MIGVLNLRYEEQFLGWVMSLVDSVKIIAPDSFALRMREESEGWRSVHQETDVLYSYRNEALLWPGVYRAEDGRGLLLPSVKQFKNVILLRFCGFEDFSVVQILDLL